MKIVAAGGSRQEAHEQIRVLSREASDVVKIQGGTNDLIERIKAAEYFRPVWAEIDSLLDPALFIGRCVAQTERYCGAGGPVEVRLAPYQAYIQQAGKAKLGI